MPAMRNVKGGPVVAEERICWFCLRRNLLQVEPPLDERYLCACGAAYLDSSWTPAEYFEKGLHRTQGMPR